MMTENDRSEELQQVIELLNAVAAAKSAVSTQYTALSDALVAVVPGNEPVRRPFHDLGDAMLEWSNRWQELYTFVLESYGSDR